MAKGQLKTKKAEQKEQKKKEPKKKKEKKKKKCIPIPETIQVEDELLENQILPSTYKGKKGITKEECIRLITTTQNPKRNVEGLVYDESQAPHTPDNTRGWKNSIWGPINDSFLQWRDKSLYKISTKNDGHIFVQYLKDDVVPSVQEGVEYFLENHSPSGVINVEGGKMAAVAGHRFVHIEDPKVDGAKANRMFRHCAVDFNEYFNSAPAIGKDYRSTMKKLTRDFHVLVFKYQKTDEDRNKGDKDVLLPGYRVSESLNTSLRTDVDDESRCYSISYQAKRKEGRAFMVFPEYSLAIRLRRYPVLITWDGARQHHCTIMVEPGIRSLWAGDNRQVQSFRQGPKPSKRRKVPTDERTSVEPEAKKQKIEKDEHVSEKIVTNGAPSVCMEEIKL